MLSDDQNVIAQVLEGDSAAYAALVDRYQKRLLGLMLHTCNRRELAEDMVQETFARAYQKLHLFSGESQFYSWLARIAMNLLASHHRKKRIENQVPREGFDVALDTQGDPDGPEELAMQSETQRCVREAIARLDEDRRKVIVLRDFDGLDYDAIAEVLEIPVGTVRSRLHRARLDLKLLLQERAGQLGLGHMGLNQS